MITDSFKRAFDRMQKRKWEKIYVLVDIHDTIIKSCYFNQEMFDYYNSSVDCLRLMSQMPEISLILWTSSYKDMIDSYLAEFSRYDIVFDMVNENIEVVNEELGCYEKKLYFNVGIDDKFGFNPETEWKVLYDYLSRYKKRQLI